ncbi:MAG: hypothetical protein ACOC2J_02610 [bacterium]
MLIDIIKVTIKQIKTIISSKFYWYCNVIFLGVIVWLLLRYLPFDTTYRILAFTIGPIFVNVLFFGVSIICLYLTEGLKKRYDKTEVYTVKEYLAITLGYIVIISCLSLPFLPLAILVCSTGSLTLAQLFQLFPLLFVNGIAFVWLGLFLKASFKENNRQYASAVLQVLWLIILVSTYFRSHNSLYINPLIIFYLFLLSAALYATVLYRSYRRNKMEGVDSNGSKT